MKDKIALYAAPFLDTESYFDKIDTAAENGLSAAEGFNHFELENPDIDFSKRLREYSDEKGVICPCFSVYADFALPNYDENIARLKKYADIAKILGSPYLHHTIVSNFTDAKETLKHKDEYYKTGIRAVREIYDYAKSIGIQTVYENQGFIFNGIEGFSSFLCDVDRDVGVIADFANIYQSKDNTSDFIRTFKDRICHVHVKDVSLHSQKIPGTVDTLNGRYALFNEDIGKGEVDFEDAFRLLKEINYDGYYAIEHTVTSNDHSELKKIIDFVSNLID